MFFSKKLKKFKNIRHCFFSRKNGVSEGSYKSLNCGLGSGDKKENVLKNLELVSKKIGCDKKSLITLNQTHSNQVIYFEKETDVKKIATQNEFLKKIGILERANILSEKMTFKAKANMFYRLKKLLDYREMGNLFKVLFAQKKGRKFSLGF